MTEIHLDQIWNDFDSYLKEVRENNETKEEENYMCCKLCGSTYNSWEFADICKDCGYIDKEYKFIDSIDTSVVDYVATKQSFKNSKLMKLNEWYMWSEEEKQDYKLKLYIQERCEILELNETQISQIVDCVTRLFKLSKVLLLGTKRSKIKDSLILVLIIKLLNLSPKHIDLYKDERNIDIKHMTKAEKIILEITQKDRTLFNILNKTHSNSPYDLIEEKLDKLIQLYEYKKIIRRTIDIIIDNDILLDNTPMSIGVTSIYYIIQKFSINIPLKTLCQLFNISVVTVSKTIQKLINVDDKLWNKINKST